ncbi:MAG: AAA family ATPase [Sporomusaceae bacterium]|nr:AAA family ATPase [Sporomusaceae bacterium]
MRRKEVALGIGGGVIIFLLWRGVNLLPLLFFAGLALLLLYGGQLRTGGKSFAVAGRDGGGQAAIAFEDIGGQDIAKQELRESLDFIMDRRRIRQLGIRPIKGILLSGPPGTGKTLLAKAAASYTNSAFVAASGSEFVEMYVGVGAQRVRQLFKQARSLAREQRQDSAVIFIDELEVLGGKRGQSNSNMEYDQTLNELLVQMDGMSGDDSVLCLVIAATNRLDCLDPALLRPGRFDRQVRVDLPDRLGRRSILALHTQNKPLAADVSLDELARDSFGFSGAHLESLTNEAAILALRQGAVEIGMEHFRSAIDKVILGEKLDRVPSPQERQRIVVHETGHALIGELTRPGSVAVITVTPRSNALGYVRQTEAEDCYLYTRARLEQNIGVALAGALAEEAVFGDRSTGAASDFQQAADLAKQIVMAGMSELGVVSPADLPQQVLHDTISDIIETVRVRTAALLAAQRPAFDRIAVSLSEAETLSGDAFRQLLQANASACAAVTAGE